MDDLKKLLDGNKTYLGFIAYGLIGLLTAYGKLDPALSEKINYVIYAWTGIAIRHALTKPK